jgi:hypothetical protein
MRRVIWDRQSAAMWIVGKVQTWEGRGGPQSKRRRVVLVHQSVACLVVWAQESRMGRCEGGGL